MASIWTKNVVPKTEVITAKKDDRKANHHLHHIELIDEIPDLPHTGIAENKGNSTNGKSYAELIVISWPNYSYNSNHIFLVDNLRHINKLMVI